MRIAGALTGEIDGSTVVGIGFAGGKLDQSALSLDDPVIGVIGQPADHGSAGSIFDLFACLKPLGITDEDGICADVYHLQRIVWIEGDIGIAASLDFMRVARSLGSQINGVFVGGIFHRGGQLDIAIAGINDVVFRRAAIVGKAADAVAAPVVVGHFFSVSQVRGKTDEDGVGVGINCLKPCGLDAGFAFSHGR